MILPDNDGLIMLEMLSMYTIFTRNNNFPIIEKGTIGPAPVLSNKKGFSFLRINKASKKLTINFQSLSECEIK